MNSRFAISEIAFIATPFGEHAWKDIPLDVKRRYWQGLARRDSKRELADIVEWSRKMWEAA